LEDERPFGFASGDQGDARWSRRGRRRRGGGRGLSPATLLAQAAYFLKGSKIALGAQDCHPQPSGAFTGDISPK